MEAIADMTPLVAWDGGRRIAAALPEAPAGAVLSAVAHGPAASACVAVWEAASGACLALLPEGAMHLDISVSAPGLDPVVVPVELDGQLAPAMIDPGQPGLSYVRLDGGVLSRTAAAGGGVAALNLAAHGAGGLRLKAGPLVDLAADDMVTAAAASLSGGALHLALARPGRPTPVLIAFLPADPASLTGAAEDAAGASGAEAAARGFRLLEPYAGGRLVLEPFGAGDRAAAFAPRNHRIAAAGAERPGTRLTLTVGDHGGLEIATAVHAYRPATSTAMAALSGGGLADADQAGRRDALADAAALAEAYWKRRRIGQTEPSGRLDGMGGGAPSPEHRWRVSPMPRPEWRMRRSPR